MFIKGPKPKSSFLSIEKDLGLITNLMLKNERLKRLLYYNTKDCLRRPNLSEDQSYALFGKNVRLVPKLLVDSEELTYIIINFDNYIPNPTNPEFRDNVIEFDIVCHFDQWQLEDFQLRPYKIAAEIDSMFNNQHLTGIGKLEFAGANQIILTSEFAGLCLMYRAVHGEEDKKFQPTPEAEEQFLKDFYDFVNADDIH